MSHDVFHTGVREIDGNALFPGIQVAVITAMTVPLRRGIAHMFADDRLELDDFRSAVCEQTGAIRTGDDLREVDDANAFERRFESAVHSEPDEMWNVGAR